MCVSWSQINADLGGVADLEACLGSPAHDDIVEDKALLFLSIHTTTLRLKQSKGRHSFCQIQSEVTTKIQSNVIN